MPNWVLPATVSHACLFNPAVAYKTSRIEKTEEREADDWYKNFNIDFILRAGRGIQQQQILRGYLFVGGHTTTTKQFLPKQRVRYLQIYAGFNFYLKKGKKVKTFSPHLPLKAVNTLHPYYIFRLILLPLPAIKMSASPALRQQRNIPR